MKVNDEKVTVTVQKVFVSLQEGPYNYRKKRTYGDRDLNEKLRIQFVAITPFFCFILKKMCMDVVTTRALCLTIYSLGLFNIIILKRMQEQERSVAWGSPRFQVVK